MVQTDFARRPIAFGEGSAGLNTLAEKFPQEYAQFLAFFGLAFPDYQNAPSLIFKRFKMFAVALTVSCDLWSPITMITFRSFPSPAASVTMPVTTMYKDDRSSRGKHKIRCAGQGAPMQPESKAKRVRQTPHHHFRCGIPPAYCTHHF